MSSSDFLSQLTLPVLPDCQGGPTTGLSAQAAPPSPRSPPLLPLVSALSVGVFPCATGPRPLCFCAGRLLSCAALFLFRLACPCFSQQTPPLSPLLCPQSPLGRGPRQPAAHKPRHAPPSPANNTTQPAHTRAPRLMCSRVPIVCSCRVSMLPRPPCLEGLLRAFLGSTSLPCLWVNRL